MWSVKLVTRWIIGTWYNGIKPQIISKECEIIKAGCLKGVSNTKEQTILFHPQILHASGEK